jgi:hypothetical protein
MNPLYFNQPGSQGENANFYKKYLLNKLVIQVTKMLQEIIITTEVNSCLFNKIKF